MNIKCLNLILAITTTFFISCNQNKKSETEITSSPLELNNNPTTQESINTELVENREPSSVRERDDENPKLTLLNLIKSEPYNPNGYRLFRYGDYDKYGNQGAAENVLTILLTESQVQEIKRYRDMYIFWDSDYGKFIVNLMIECFKNNELICDCRNK